MLLKDIHLIFDNSPVHMPQTLSAIPYLEGQRDIASRFITRIPRVTTWLMGVINLFTKSRESSIQGRSMSRGPPVKGSGFRGLGV